MDGSPQSKIKSLEEIRQILQDHMPDLKERYSVHSLGIFGSYVRGEADESSDIDILVEFDKVPSLLKLIRMEDELSEHLGAKVDLVPKKGLKKHIGERVLEEVVPV